MLLKICITAMLETQTAFVMFQINKTILLLIHFHGIYECDKHSKATDSS